MKIIYLNLFAIPVACMFFQGSSVLKTMDISCLTFLHERHIVDFSTASEVVMETRDSYECLPLNDFKEVWSQSSIIHVFSSWMIVKVNT